MLVHELGENTLYASSTFSYFFQTYLEHQKLLENITKHYVSTRSAVFCLFSRCMLLWSFAQLSNFKGYWIILGSFCGFLRTEPSRSTVCHYHHSELNRYVYEYCNQLTLRNISGLFHAISSCIKFIWYRNEMCVKPVYRNCISFAEIN
jgi:hypothetical protein